MDSLQLVPLLPTGATNGIDMGSGAGFPGLVLAIASGVHFDLIEADHRKAAFLREVVAATDASASVHASRVERVVLEPADVLTARALAPLDNLLDLASRLLKPGGTALFPKGARVEPEIEVARTNWSMQVESQPSLIDPESVILRITGMVRRDA